MSRRKVMGARKPGGRLKARKPQDPRFPTLWRRIKDHGLALGVHPYMGTALGRLSLMGALTDHQTEAGFRFAEIVGRYHRLCTGARPYTAASPAYERGFGQTPPVSDAMIARTERAAKRARRAYERMMRCMPSAAAEALLVELCIENRDAPSSRHGDVAVLLGAVAARLGIAGDERRVSAKRAAEPVAIEP